MAVVTARLPRSYPETRAVAWLGAGLRSIASTSRDLAYRETGSRDYRIDLVRGFLVFAMVVDHLGGNSLFNTLTGNNQFLTSAAEGFVFVSGLLMGIVYGRRILRQGLTTAISAVVRRAIFLYVTVTALTLSFVGLFLFTDIPLWFDRAYGLGVASPLEAVGEALKLRYTYNGTDILLVYVLLVGLAPLSFGALKRGWTLPALLVSWSLWALYQFAPDRAALPWPFDSGLSFPLAPWQALFTSGLVLGYHRRSLAPLLARLRSWPLVLSFGAAFVGMLLLSAAQREGRLVGLGLPGLNDASFAWLFDKASLGPGRLLAFFLVAGLVYQVVTLLWRPLVAAFGWLLLPLGQNSLLAYGLHLALLGLTRELLGWALYDSPQFLLYGTLAQIPLLLAILLAIRLQAPLSALQSRGAVALGAVASSAVRALGSPRFVQVLASAPSRQRGETS